MNLSATNFRNTGSKVIFILFALTLSFSCKEQIPVIDISDNELFHKNKSHIILPYSEVKAYFTDHDTAIFTYHGESVCYQLDDIDGDGTPDEWASNMKPCPDEPKTGVHFGKSEKHQGPVSAYGIFTLYGHRLPKNANFDLQTDGPSWENNLVGFRHYLDGRNGRDIFGKRDPEIILSEVGLTDTLTQTDNYHVLEPWGRDILSVGNSLGAGGLAIKDDDKIVRLGITAADSIDNVDSTMFRLINNGPVRALFALNYYGWQLSDRKIDVRQIIEIWPDVHYYTNRVWLSNNKQNDTLVIGLVNNNNSNPPIFIDSLNSRIILATHDKQTYNKEYYLGMAIGIDTDQYSRFSEARYENTAIQDSYLLFLNQPNEEPYKFHVFSGWELQNEVFIKKEDFINQVLNEFSDL